MPLFVSWEEVGEPRRPGNLRPETFYGPSAGLTEVLIPATAFGPLP